MGHKFCEGLLRLGRGRTTYESNSSMPSEAGLEQLGACAQDPDLGYVFHGCKTGFPFQISPRNLDPWHILVVKNLHFKELLHPKGNKFNG